MYFELQQSQSAKVFTGVVRQVGVDGPNSRRWSSMCVMVVEFVLLLLQSAGVISPDNCGYYLVWEGNLHCLNDCL